MDSFGSDSFKKLPSLQLGQPTPRWNLPSVDLCPIKNGLPKEPACSTFQISPRLCAAPPQTKLSKCSHSECSRLLHRCCQTMNAQNTFYPFCLECSILKGVIGFRFLHTCLPFREFMDGIEVDFEVSHPSLDFFDKDQSLESDKVSNEVQLAFRYGILARQGLPHDKFARASYRMVLDSSLIGLIQPNHQQGDLVVGTIRLGLLTPGKHTLSVRKIGPKCLNHAKNSASVPVALVFGALGLISTTSPVDLLKKIYPSPISPDSSNKTAPAPVLVKGSVCTEPNCVFELNDKHIWRKGQQLGNQVWRCEECNSPILELVGWDTKAVSFCSNPENRAKQRASRCCGSKFENRNPTRKQDLWWS